MYSLQPYGPQAIGLLCPRNFPGDNTGVGCHFLLQGIPCVIFINLKNYIDFGVKVRCYSDCSLCILKNPVFMSDITLLTPNFYIFRNVFE